MVEYADVEGVEEHVAYPLLSPRFPPRALQHCKENNCCLGRVSLSFLEKAMNFGLGVHDHELGDLAVQCRFHACGVLTRPDRHAG